MMTMLEAAQIIQTILRDGVNIEDCLVKMEQSTDPQTYENYAFADAMRNCVRMVCTVCLLADNPDLITPDVLARDRAAFDRTRDQKYIDRAVRIGKRGWLVGAKTEVDPHFRRPHFAFRWTGKGRVELDLVPVKGCIVKRQKVTDVPTGFLDVA